MTNKWYKNIIIYGLDVKVYCDSDGDGTGDFQGLISKLDYLASLGITCIWLMPFYPSPKADNGYDVSDYYNIDPALGTLGDFVQFMHEAKKRGLYVLIDLVANHTSIEHPWFMDAKKSRNSKYRNYYIWTDEPKENKEKIMLDGFEESIWEYNEPTDSYYLHRYFHHQADLNISNPEVQNEILKIIDFWLKLGVDGFRIDAAHVISDPVDVEHIDFGNLHKFFSTMRGFIEERNSNAVLLGEVSVPPEELKKYVGGTNYDNHRLHLLFNFISNKYSMLGFARKSGETLAEGINLYEPVDMELAHWTNFVRHHDELNLELLNEAEQKEVMDHFAPEKDMRIFGHGIRRRLAPMLNNNMERVRLMYSIMAGLPGIPLISYGEEIGMGDDLDLPGRNSVRTPMQWSDDKNGGFSKAAKENLYRPVIDSGDYSYKRINVKNQLKDRNSFLNFISHLIKTRRQHPVIGKGRWEILKTNAPEAVAIYYEEPYENLITLYNLSDKTIELKVEGGFTARTIVEEFNDSPYEGAISLNKLKLKPFGFRWIKLLDKEEIQFIN